MISWRELRKLDPTIEPEDDEETKAWLDELGTEDEWREKINKPTPFAEREYLLDVAEVNHGKRRNRSERRN